MNRALKELREGVYTSTYFEIKLQHIVIVVLDFPKIEEEITAHSALQWF